MMGAAEKTEEIIYPIIVLILSTFKMLEQGDETPEVTTYFLILKLAWAQV